MDLNESRRNKFKKLLRLPEADRQELLKNNQVYRDVWARFNNPNSPDYPKTSKILNNEITNQAVRAGITSRAAKKLSSKEDHDSAYASKNNSFSKIEYLTNKLKKKNMPTNAKIVHPRNFDDIEREDGKIIKTPIAQITDNENRVVSHHSDKEYGKLRTPEEKKYSMGNDKYHKVVTGKDLNQTATEYIAKHNLKEEESIFGNSEFAEKISDVIKQVEGITYGFISTKDGSRIDNREFIHSCTGPELQAIYTTNWDPRITIKNQLGICVDQCLAIKYLMEQLHPEIKVSLYALYKGRFGHCVCTLEDADGKFYYLENAWDKERGLHEFNSKEELEEYLNYIYHKHHDKDNDDPVEVLLYTPPVDYDRFSMLQEQCFLYEFKEEN